MSEHVAPQPPNFMGSPRTRMWIYTIFIGITAAMGVWGIIDGDKINAINIIVSAVLGIAAGNTPTGVMKNE